jgi:hypothetical protein
MGLMLVMDEITLGMRDEARKKAVVPPRVHGPELSEGPGRRRG